MIEQIDRLPLLDNNRTREGDIVMEVAEIITSRGSFLGYVAGKLTTTDTYLVYSPNSQDGKISRPNYLPISDILKYRSLTISRELYDVFG